MGLFFGTEEVTINGDALKTKEIEALYTALNYLGNLANLHPCITSYLIPVIINLQKKCNKAKLRQIKLNFGPWENQSTLWHLATE